MRKISGSVGFWFILVSALIGAVAAPRSVGAQAGPIVPHKVVLRLSPGASIVDIDRDYDTRLDEQISEAAVYSVYIPSGANEQAFASRMNADPRIDYAEPDAVLSAFHGNPFIFAFDASFLPGSYSSPEAYRQVNLGRAHCWSMGAGVVVAVLDTGVALDHPALRSRLTTGYNAVDSTQDPWDVPDGINNSAVGHGTFVAGMIAQIAPAAQIMPVRVLNGDGLGTLMDVVQGIHYAVSNGAKVINMSFGCADDLPALADAVRQAEAAGVVLVSSAGNSGVAAYQYPAAYAGVIAVAAVETDNTRAWYSNYGDHIAVVAPGTDIRSTYWDGGYASWSGTSFAAPFVAAEAVLLLGRYPALTPDDIQDLIRDTATNVDLENPGLEGLLGDGLINIEKAVGGDG